MAADEDFEDLEDLDPTLRNIVDQDSLKWIFVGGKGGVGKTTTSCSLATMMALSKPDEKVLIISTDPAHNLSDAFGQQLGSSETKIQNMDNLWAMEIDPKVDFSDFGDEFMESKTASFLSELSSSVPGIDEAMSFAELIKQLKKKDFSKIIFDTAPTGHTLRLLSFPTILEKAIAKLEGLKQQFGGVFQNFTQLLMANRGPQGGPMPNTEELGKKLEGMKELVEQIKTQFEDYRMTTFVCVCIPEFLSLYETERLVQKLAGFGIDSHNIVINQVLFPEKGSTCRRCAARVKMQGKYIEQFEDLYSDFHLVKIPLLSEEVRHLPLLKSFAWLLLNGYDTATEERDIDHVWREKVAQNTPAAAALEHERKEDA